MDYTREELISIAEQGIVPQNKWSDRDSATAQQQLGVALVYLKAGCRFEVDRVENETILGRVFSQGFRSFEYGENPEEMEQFADEHDFYLPTTSKLAARDGRDWY